MPRIDGFYLSGNWSEAWGRDAVARLFDGRAVAARRALLRQRPDRARLADALRERGIAVPADVAVVGFDNWDVMAHAARPPLTSVDMNLKALGREAGDRLIEMIAGKRGERRRAGPARSWFANRPAG